MNRHRERIYWSNIEVDNIIKEKFFDITRIGDCVSAIDRIKFKCNKCSHEWETTAATLRICKKHGCPKCANILRLTNDIVDERIKNRKILRLDSYKTARLPMRWRCLVCNYEWVSSADNIMAKGRGCASCDGQMQITNEYVDEKLKINNPKVLRIGNISSSKNNCEFKCIECGKTWEATAGNVYRNKNPSGCPKCLYKRERYVHDFLISNMNNEFKKHQYRVFYSQKKKFIIDFYLKINDRDVFIEYNGEQHYRPFRFGDKNCIDAFDKQVKRDNLLREFCKNQQIILIELPYTMTNEEIQDKLLNLKNEIR